MRGCTRGCRFCQAGQITRPVRERSVEEVVEAAETAIRLTGFEELALLSLSSSDYTPILDLVNAISERFAGRHLTVGLPSLRIESVSVDLMEKLKDRRSSGFTLAPEAASERMRRIINKYIPDEQILATAGAIFSRGWTTLKLYFMIGHPSETIEDVQAIVDLCRRVMAEGRRALGGKARLNVGVSTFIPKPHTPFQWCAVDPLEQINRKQDLLKRELRDRSIKLTWSAPEETLLEASRQYHSRTGRSFWKDLVDEERQRGQRYIGENGSVAALASFAPQGNREVQIIFKGTSNLMDLRDGEIGGFADCVVRLLKIYKGMGVNSFNISTFSGPMGSNAEYYSLHAKLILRPVLEPFYRNDTGILERFHREADIDVMPEAFAESARQSWVR